MSTIQAARLVDKQARKYRKGCILQGQLGEMIAKYNLLKKNFSEHSFQRLRRLELDAACFFHALEIYC